MRYFLIALALMPVLGISIAYSQTDTSFFPLALGNQWIYESSHFGRLDTETVIDTQTVNGRLYFGIAAYSSSLIYWLRADSNKIFIAPNLVITDTSDVKQAMWYDFGAPANTQWSVRLFFDGSLAECDLNGITFVMYKGHDMIQFFHSPPCRDAGRLSEWFRRGTGRIQYCQDNIAGTDTFNLVKTNLPTAVSVSSKIQPTNTFVLSQNYPNPFNPSTRITFRLPKRMHVEVAVFDALGRKLETLIDSYENLGEHSVIWDASDRSSGVYFCRIHTRGFTQTTKLVLLR